MDFRSFCLSLSPDRIKALINNPETELRDNRNIYIPSEGITKGNIGGTFEIEGFLEYSLQDYGVKRYKLDEDFYFDQIDFEKINCIEFVENYTNILQKIYLPDEFEKNPKIDSSSSDSN